MSRLSATIRTDVRVQFRNGFYVATLLVMIFSVALLRWLPAEIALLFLPVVIIENVLINTFYFVGGLLLLEREEGTLLARAVTPLRIGEYLASKLVTLTVLSLVESLVIALCVFGLESWLIPMALGIAIAAVLFCLIGIALVVRYHSINEFLLPSVPYTFVLSLPLLGLFGIGTDAWYLPHPVQGPLSLMQIEASRTAGQLAYSIAYPLLWIVPVYFWASRSLAKARHA